MKINIDEFVAEWGDIQRQVTALTEKLALVSDPQKAVEALPLSECQRICKTITDLRSSLDPVLFPAKQTFVHALQHRMFYAIEAKWWLNFISQTLNDEIDFNQFDSELVTFKNLDIDIKIEPSMVTQVALVVLDDYDYDDNGGTYTTYRISGRSKIHWNAPEMHPLIHQLFEFHTDDEEAINEIIDTILDTLNEQIIEHIIDDLDIDDVINIDDWLDKTRSLDEITIPIEQVLSNP